MNILCIFADQMHKYAMGCMGNENLSTPHLDALASEGVLFTRAYTNNPICSPFRVHLMTGLYSSDTDSLGNECVIPEDCVTLPTLMRKADYTTSYVGKWHVGGKGNGPIPERHKAGFDHFIGYQCYNGFLDDVCFYDEEDRELRFDGKHRTDVTADLALERLATIKDGPFIQYVCFQAPHYPEEPSDKYYRMYRNRTIVHPPNYVEGVEPYTGTWSPRSPQPKEKDRNFQRYGGDMDEYKRCYNAMVTQIDANVGRLIEYLKTEGLWDNTAVFFFADHGDMQGAHGLVNKCLPWEESAGIPFIARIPGGLAGHVSKEFVSGVDPFPTFLELAGLEDENPRRGVSLVELLTKSDARGGGRSAFSEGPRGDWIMLCQGDHKLVADRNTEKAILLFNLSEDPYEKENLTEKEPERVKAMLPRLLEILRSVDNMYIKNI